jgi:hypothetical protein
MAVGSTVATSDKHPLDQVLPFGQMFIYGLQLSVRLWLTSSVKLRCSGWPG